MLTIFVPGPVRNPMNGSHGHWAKHARWAKSWRERTAQRLLVHQRMTPAYAALFRTPTSPKHITFVCSTVRRIDPDALPAICKPLLDGCRDAHLIHDDGPQSGHIVRYQQQIAPQHRGVAIIVQAT